MQIHWVSRAAARAEGRSWNQTGRVRCPNAGCFSDAGGEAGEVPGIPDPGQLLERRAGDAPLAERLRTAGEQGLRCKFGRLSRRCRLCPPLRNRPGTHAPRVAGDRSGDKSGASEQVLCEVLV